MRPPKQGYLINLTLLAAALVLSVGVGSVFIAPGTVIRILLDRLPGVAFPPTWPDAFPAILLQVRIPHAVLILLTGSALAGSGAAYQGVFRNPLADPFLIGVASGAGLGAVVALSLEWPRTLLGFYAVPAAAFIGALGTVTVVYSLARVGRTLPTTTLILAGVAVNAFATAITSYLMLGSEEELRRAVAWLLGGGILGGWNPVWAVLPFWLLGVGALVTSGHVLNVLQFGEEQARQLGLPVTRVRTVVILAASLAAAAAVAFTGIIGFVGLVSPHLARLLWGADHRHLVPLSLLGGATMLLFADLLARTAFAPQVLPVGIVTALAGAPFFIWVLRRARAAAFW